MIRMRIQLSTGKEATFSIEGDSTLTDSRMDRFPQQLRAFGDSPLKSLVPGDKVWCISMGMEIAEEVVEAEILDTDAQ